MRERQSSSNVFLSFPFSFKCLVVRAACCLSAPVAEGEEQACSPEELGALSQQVRGCHTLSPELHSKNSIKVKHMHCEMTGRYRKDQSIPVCGLLQTSCLQIFFKAPEDRTVSPHLCTVFMIHSLPSLMGNQLFSTRNFGYRINNTRSKGE